MKFAKHGKAKRTNRNENNQMVSDQFKMVVSYQISNGSIYANFAMVGHRGYNAPYYDKFYKHIVWC